MNSTASQERKGPGKPPAIPPEELKRRERLERISRMSVPSINQLVIDSLNCNCIEPFIPPIKVD